MGEIVLDRRNGLAFLVIDNIAKRNAISMSMWRELEQRIDEIARDRDIKVVVLRGAGERSFASGADIDEFLPMTGDRPAAAAYAELYARVQAKLHRLDRPTIAMIHGACIGGGCGLATACDFRICDEAGKFGVPAAKLGQVYRVEETSRLVGLIGQVETKLLLYTGRIITAAHAQAIGLVDDVVPAAALQERVLTLAAEIAAVSQFSVRSAKAAIGDIMSGKVEDDGHSTARFLDALEGEDCREGISAFLEGRAPKFTFQ